MRVLALAPPGVRIVVAPIDFFCGGERTQDVARYGQAFKDKAVARLLPPESATLQVVAQDVGIAAGTLERWLK